MMSRSAIFYYLVKLLGPETALDFSPCTSVVKEKAKLKKVVNKSTLVIDIKPKELETNLKLVEDELRKIKITGLEWSAASKIVPIAFGLNKLQMGCVIIDDLVATDDIILKIEQLGMTSEQALNYEKIRDAGEEEEEKEESSSFGFVQSAEIVSFQKL